MTMRLTYRFLLATAMVLLGGADLVAQQTMQWQPNLETAQRLAEQTNRLVLVHFTADWCSACRRMEREVLSQPATALALNGEYVAVLINTEDSAATATRYGIEKLPTDVIITARGEEVDRFIGSMPATQYLSRLGRIAKSVRQRSLARTSQLAAAGAPRYAPVAPAYAAERAEPPRQDRRPVGTPTLRQSPPPLPPLRNQSPPAEYYVSDARSPRGVAGSLPPDSRPSLPPLPPRQSAVPFQAPPMTMPRSSPVVAHRPRSSAPPAIRGDGVAPAGNPPLGLDGYCPVTLADNSLPSDRLWVAGSPQWGAVHRGRTYLFAGPEQQRIFMADPDRFAPVLSGNDPVLARDEGRFVPGTRKHGVFFTDDKFGRHVYLFVSPASLGKFKQNSLFYAEHIYRLSRPEAHSTYR